MRADDQEQVFVDICDELGCARDNEAVLEAISALKRAAFASIAPRNALEERALQIVRILANTPPEDWLLRSEIHAGLSEFR